MRDTIITWLLRASATLVLCGSGGAAIAVFTHWRWALATWLFGWLIGAFVLPGIAGVLDDRR